MRPTIPTYTVEGLKRTLKGFRRDIDDLYRRSGGLPDHSHPGVGGKPYATVVIAASNSTAEDKANADYTCDGTADQEQWELAEADLPTTGGMILGLEGTFNFSVEASMAKNGVHLAGMGAGTRILATTNLFRMFGLYGRDQSVSDMTIGDNGWSDITGVYLDLSSDNFHLYNLWFDFSLGLADPAGEHYCVWDTGADDGEIGPGIFIFGGRVGIFDQGPRTRIHDGNIENLDSNGIAGGPEVQIHDWRIRSGGHGISLSNSLRPQVHDNDIEATGVASDGIILLGNTDEGYIRHNRAKGARYGVNVSAATCNDNIVVANDCRGSGTAKVNDAGTGTLVVYPGAAAPQGDNF